VEDASTNGAMFVPVVVGSDKTTVSVATGHQEYHPVYMYWATLQILQDMHMEMACFLLLFFQFQKVGFSLLSTALFWPMLVASNKHREAAKF
jgi:hypothetical protein